MASGDAALREQRLRCPARPWPRGSRGGADLFDPRTVCDGWASFARLNPGCHFPTCQGGTVARLGCCNTASPQSHRGIGTCSGSMARSPRNRWIGAGSAGYGSFPGSALTAPHFHLRCRSLDGLIDQQRALARRRAAKACRWVAGTGWLSRDPLPIWLAITPAGSVPMARRAVRASGGTGAWGLRPASIPAFSSNCKHWSAILRQRPDVMIACLTGARRMKGLRDASLQSPRQSGGGRPLARMPFRRTPSQAPRRPRCCSRRGRDGVGTTKRTALA